MSNEETHNYTDRTTGYTVGKRWRLLSVSTGTYYKLYDGKGHYVRSFEARVDAIYAAKVGKK
jgi:hypothetical protein